MSSPKSLSRNISKGISFQVSELLILAAWAEFHGLQMRIELDHCVEGEEYEEIATFYATGGTVMKWIMWRSPEHVVLQPMVGPTRRFATLCNALEAALPEPLPEPAD
jgi:hypothetical protein